MLAAVVVLAVTPATAQPVACDACARGDAVIARLSLEAVRPLARELAALSLAEPLTPPQYERVIALRQRTPALVRLGALDDIDLTLIAAALCGAPSDACTASTTLALRCLADRCEVALSEADPRDAGGDVRTEACRPSDATRRTSPALGVGFDWGNGVQRSGYPSDGRAWSFGIEGRLRIAGRLGAVVRVDRAAGRDQATDTDADGRDDRSTGSITRIAALAGPSLVLDHTRHGGALRSLRLDLLGGYLATRSQTGESGPAAGLDLAYQASVFRTGVRVVQAFGGARDAAVVLAHLGFLFGSAPEYHEGGECGTRPAIRDSRVALGFGVPLGGTGFSSELGYLATGLAVEGLWHLTPSFDAATRADLLLFPGGERDRVIHQAVLGGVRMDHGSHGRRSSRTGLFTTVLAGYSHGAGFTPTAVGSGPIVDVSLAWGGQSSDSAAYLRVHGRLGVGPDNRDYRVVFVAAGFELRFDWRRWRGRP